MCGPFGIFHANYRKKTNTLQLMATFCLGFMGFSAVTFYLSLYLQEVKHQTALEITVKLLPMVVSGVLVNVVCGLVLHRVSNKVLTGIGALAYTASFLILSFMKEDATYWAFIFPALVLVVVGADIQFNVTNVRPFSMPHYSYLYDMFGLLTLLDVRHVLSTTIPAIHCRWNLQYGQQALQ
jgi:predicted MFS family arabinose efflux permease